MGIRTQFFARGFVQLYNYLGDNNNNLYRIQLQKIVYINKLISRKTCSNSSAVVCWVVTKYVEHFYFCFVTRYGPQS